MERSRQRRRCRGQLRAAARQQRTLQPVQGCEGISRLLSCGWTCQFLAIAGECILGLASKVISVEPHLDIARLFESTPCEAFDDIWMTEMTPALTKSIDRWPFLSRKDREYGETHHAPGYSSARGPCCSCSLGQRSINLGGVECRNNERL